MKSGRQKQIYVNTYIWTLIESGTDEPVCRAEIETDIENRLVGPGVAGKGRVDLGGK